VQYSGLKTGAVVSSETSKASTNTKQRYRSLTFYSETSVSLTVPIAAIKTTFWFLSYLTMLFQLQMLYSVEWGGDTITNFARGDRGLF